MRTRRIWLIATVAALRLRERGRPLDAFLARHGGLAPEERAALLSRFGAIADEVGLK